MTEYGPVEERLARLEDKLTELINTTIALAGQKPRNTPSSPRPVPAAKRLQDRARIQKHQALVARVLPGSGGPKAQVGALDELSRADRRPKKH